MVSPDLADPKPAKRIRDPALLAQLHREWRECALCGSTQRRMSLHHIHKHPRDDVRANLAMLCGDGTTGEHGLIEAHSSVTSLLFGKYLIEERKDTMEYLGQKLGGLLAVYEWMRGQGLIV